MTSTTALPFRFSPLPPKSYFIPVKASCCARATQGLRYADATWNALWLSCPEIDGMTDLKPGWCVPNSVIANRLKHLVVDIREDEEFAAALLTGPDSFLHWWEQEDHTLYCSYEHCGEQKWVDTVSARAELAARNLLINAPVIVRVGNVLMCNFQRPTH